MRRILLAILFAWFIMASHVAADPVGAGITSNVTETVDPAEAGSSTTAGGSFTTLVLNATTQTPNWKAYVGNVTGTFALRDADNETIYDWNKAASSGEVFASRVNAINWSLIKCANGTTITAEHNALNHTITQVDGVNNTFNDTVHRGFWVGTVEIANSTCPAIATYVNSQAQTRDENADFQEVMLQDNTATIVYTGLLDMDTAGYDNRLFDFQIIVPEDQYASSPHTYYFWLELS